MGGDLVERGGTHLDIHRNISDLLVYAPSVITKLKMLLQEVYGVKTIHQPIAFRVSITLPLDSDNWHFQKGALNLINAVNRTVRTRMFSLVCVSFNSSQSVICLSLQSIQRFLTINWFSRTKIPLLLKTLAQLEKHILSHNYEPSFFKSVFTKPFRDIYLSIW